MFAQMTHIYTHSTKVIDISIGIFESSIRKEITALRSRFINTSKHRQMAVSSINHQSNWSNPLVCRHMARRMFAVIVTQNISFVTHPLESTHRSHPVNFGLWKAFVFDLRKLKIVMRHSKTKLLTHSLDTTERHDHTSIRIVSPTVVLMSSGFFVM